MRRLLRLAPLLLPLLLLLVGSRCTWSNRGGGSSSRSGSGSGSGSGGGSGSGSGSSSSSTVVQKQPHKTQKWTMLMFAVKLAKVGGCDVNPRV